MKVVLLAVSVLVFASFQASNATSYTLSELALAVKGVSNIEIVVDSVKNDVPFANLRITGSNNTIRAAKQGEVIFDSSFNITITVTGNNNTISGFQFIGTKGDATNNFIYVSGDKNTFQDLNFYAVWASHTIFVNPGTSCTTISNCNFEAKPTSILIRSPQVLFASDAKTADVVSNHHIVGCTFRNMPGEGGDFGNVPLRLGLGGAVLSSLGVLVEYSVFFNTTFGDTEALSVKSSGNTIRFNTFQSQTSVLSFRSGESNVAYGNFFLSAGGIRLRQANYLSIFNNYFESSAAPILFEDISFSSAAPGTYQTFITFQHNTFYNSTGSSNLGTATLFHNNWVSNVFFQPIGHNSAVQLFVSDSNNTGAEFTQNFYKGITGWSNSVSGLTNVVVDTPATPTTPTTPTTPPTPPTTAFELNADGYYSPTENSSLIVGLAVVSVTGVTRVSTDITTRLRPLSLHTVGCSEPYASGSISDPSTVVNHPLTVTAVGPSYVRPPVSASSANIKLVNTHLSPY